MTFDNVNDKFNFKGHILTLTEFADKYCEGNMDDAKGAAEVLFKKGAIKPIAVQKTPQEKAIERAMAEQEITNMVETIDNQEQARKISKLNDKVAGGQVHKRVDLEFPNMYKAQEAELVIIEKYGIQDTEVSIRKGVAYLILRNVPDRVLAMIERSYTTDRAIEAGLGIASNAVEKLSGGVEYTATKIAAPAMQIATAGGVSILKSLFKVATKTGATLVTAGSQGIKQTSAEIRRDPDIIRAKNELLSAKDGISRTMLTSGGRSSGIRVSDED